MGINNELLSTPVPVIVRQCIKDCIRSIQRGLGTSKLKDAFNGMLLGSLPISESSDGFSFSDVTHCRDMVVIGLWFMLREPELANAKPLTLAGWE